MAYIAPFAAIHYAPEKVSIREVIAPPYDVLSPAQQDALYARHPDNVVRLMLNRITSEDNDTDNRYTRSAAFLRDALERGVLVRENTPALYEYIQLFEHPLDAARIVERRTLFVALKLEPYANGVVLPHEETHPKAKADRLLLMRATHANPEPIYGLYSDPQLRISTLLEQGRGDTTPLVKASYPGKNGPENEQHLIYRHSNRTTIEAIEAFLAPERIWIADGHHRYETALNYQAEQKEKQLPSGDDTGAELVPSDFILIGLSAFEDPGMVVLPTHRLVKNVPAERLEDLPLQLQRYFHVHTLPITEARVWIKEEIPGEKRFAILLPDRAYALTLRDLALAETAMEMEEAGRTHSTAWQHLDVTILQFLVLDRTLGISWQELAHTPDVAYTRDEEEAVQKVQSGEFQLSCLLQNPTVTEVRDVASAGDKMPQKSTFFYPKLYSGLIIRPLE